MVQVDLMRGTVSGGFTEIKREYRYDNWSRSIGPEKQGCERCHLYMKRKNDEPEEIK